MTTTPSRRYTVYRVAGGKRQHVGYVSAETERGAVAEYRKRVTRPGPASEYEAVEAHTKWRKPR